MQPGETDTYDVDDHVQALIRHADKGIVHYVLANDAFDGPPPPGSDWVRLPTSPFSGYRLLTADLRDRERPWRHDPERMARPLMELLTEVSGIRASQL